MTAGAKQPAVERTLASDHTEDLAKSGLTAATIERLGFSSVRPHDIPRLNGVRSAYRIPYFDLDGNPIGFERLKLLPPCTANGGTQKYYQAPDTDPRPYFPPLLNWRQIASDPARELVITEGEKKAASAAQAGLHAVGIAGTWNFRVRTDSGKRAVLPALDEFNWSGRRVCLVPDSDAWRSKDRMHQVLSGFYALGMELARRGASVRLLRLPEPDGAKVGLDDWLCKQSTAAQEAFGHLERLSLDNEQLKDLARWYQQWNWKEQHRSGGMAAKVNEIRMKKGLMPFQLKRELAELVITEIRRTGRLIRAATGERFFFDASSNAPRLLDSEEFKTWLYMRFGLNATEEETRFIENHLRTVAAVHGELVEIRYLAFFSVESGRLYVDANNGTVFVLDGTTIVKADNGIDGVLFRQDRTSDPIVPDLTAPAEWFDRAFANPHLGGNTGAQLRALALLKAWTIGLFFRELMPTFPILSLVGEQQSGKSSLARRIGKLVYGSSFEVGSFRNDKDGERDLLASMTRHRLEVFDNADGTYPYLADLLCKAATGAEVKFRKLHTTNTEECYRLLSSMIITCRDTKWNRDDLASRQLPIRLEPIPDGPTKIREMELQEEMRQSRPQMFGALLQLLNRTVAEIRAATTDVPFRSHHRLADFHAFGRLAARALDIELDFEAAMEMLDQDQLNLLAHGDARLDLFKDWMDARPPHWGGETIKTTELFRQIEENCSAVEKKTFPFKNATALGSWLGRSEKLIRTQCSVVVEKASPHARSWRISPE